MTISNFSYSPQKGADPRLTNTWASKTEVEVLEHQITILRERLATLERDFTYFHHHMKEK